MLWSDITAEHLGRDALVSERTEFSHDAWRTVYAGTVVFQADGRPVLNVKTFADMVVPWDWEVQIRECDNEMA